MDLSALAVPVDTLKPVPKPVSVADRARVEKTAKDFEASFVSVMLGQMFESLPTDGPFGGGQGEATFRSFLTDAMAKSMTAHGGIGLSKTIQREMLKMQGLTDAGAHK